MSSAREQQLVAVVADLLHFMRNEAIGAMNLGNYGLAIRLREKADHAEQSMQRETTSKSPIFG